MYKDENGKTCDFYKNNDIRKIINKAINQFKHFQEKFQNKEVKIFCDYMRVQNIKSAWNQLLIEPLYYYKSY